MAYQIIVKKRFTNKVQKFLLTLKKNGRTKWQLNFLRKLTVVLNYLQDNLMWALYPLKQKT